MKITTNIRHKIAGSPLHSNSVFLMASQGIMMLCGYAFWIIAARLYHSTEVGLAGTLISITMLVSQLSILGFNNALVRFLPGSDRKNEKINTALWLVVIASLLVALGYIIGMPLFSPSILFVRHDWIFLLLFLVAMVLATVNTFTDSVFLANQATKHNLAIYTGYSLVRLALPFMFVSFGALGIFAAHTAGVVAAVALSFYYMVRKFHYRPALHISKDIVRLFSGYSLTSYLAGFLWGFPILIAPILIVNQLGASAAAYFYMVMMIVNVLLIIPTATTQSLFAEGSHGQTSRLLPLTVRSLRFSLGFTILGVLGTIALGKYAMGLFGHEYAHQGAAVLYVLAAATFLVTLNMTGNTVLKVRKKIWTLVAVNAIGAVTTVAAFVFFLHWGIIGAGLGYLAGQAAHALVFAGMFGASLLRRRLPTWKPAALLSE